MKKKDFQELKNREISKLVEIVAEKRKELARISVKITAGEEKNLKKAKDLRRELARILTLIREKEIVADLKPVEIKQESKEEMKK